MVGQASDSPGKTAGQQAPHTHRHQRPRPAEPRECQQRDGGADHLQLVTDSPGRR